MIFAITFGVYAFIEPASGPATDYVINWLSPLNAMHNDTNSRAQGLSGITANAGMYDNRIPQGSFPLAYTEICFKNGNVYSDSHLGGESTSGGNCEPGDVGYVIEQNERSADYWEGAKATCTKINMRLPENFEYKYGCKNAGSFGLSSMTGNWEWSSNEALPMYYGANHGLGTTIIGSSGCSYAGWGIVGNVTGYEPLVSFRCAR